MHNCCLSECTLSISSPIDHGGPVVGLAGTAQMFTRAFDPRGYVDDMASAHALVANVADYGGLGGRVHEHGHLAHDLPFKERCGHGLPQSVLDTEPSCD